jgi:hypothetical protein
LSSPYGQRRRRLSELRDARPPPGTIKSAARAEVGDELLAYLALMLVETL